MEWYSSGELILLVKWWYTLGDVHVLTIVRMLFLFCIVSCRSIHKHCSWSIHRLAQMYWPAIAGSFTATSRGHEESEMSSLQFGWIVSCLRVYLLHYRQFLDRLLQIMIMGRVHILFHMQCRFFILGSFKPEGIDLLCTMCVSVLPSLPLYWPQYLLDPVYV